MKASHSRWGASSLVVVAGAAAVPLLIASVGWGAWNGVLGVPGMSPHFLDLRIITGGAPCASRGMDVYLDGHCDPLGRRFNLPPVWLLLGHLGLTDAAAPWLGPLFGFGAVMVFAALMRDRSVAAGIAALAALLSPSVMLGFERGNVDLVMFVLVGCAALLLADETRPRLAASFSLLALAVMAKLYPVFCCAVAVRSGRMVAFGSALLLLGVGYLIGIADFLGLIRGNTDVTPDHSYGYLVPFMFVERYAAPQFGFSVAGLSAGALPIALVSIWCALVAGASLALWRRDAQHCVIATGTAGAAFTFGAAIYCGSFLFSASNYAYRLIFVLLCLPQLFDWVGDSTNQHGDTRKAAWILLALIYFLLWYLVRGNNIWAMISLCEYLAFAGLAGILLLDGLRNNFGGPAKFDAMRRTS